MFYCTYENHLPASEKSRKTITFNISIIYSSAGQGIVLVLGPEVLAILRALREADQLDETLDAVAAQLVQGPAVVSAVPAVVQAIPVVQPDAAVANSYQPSEVQDIASVAEGTQLPPVGEIREESVGPANSSQPLIQVQPQTFETLDLTKLAASDEQESGTDAPKVRRDITLQYLEVKN